jgi:hypothetical protein
VKGRCVNRTGPEATNLFSDEHDAVLVSVDGQLEGAPSMLPSCSTAANSQENRSGRGPPGKWTIREIGDALAEMPFHSVGRMRVRRDMAIGLARRTGGASWYPGRPITAAFSQHL